MTTPPTIIEVPAGDAPGRAGIPPLGRQASSGFFWLLAQSGCLKITSLLGQFALAWLLRKEDFGTYALALLISLAVGLIHQSGVAGVLISRSNQLARWVSPAFWLSLFSGVLASLVMIAAAPVAAWGFHNPNLRGLIYLFSLAPIFNSIAVVPQAILQANMRFRPIALIGLFSGVAATGLTVGLAVLGFHAYSFVIPSIAASAFTAAYLWRLSRPKIKLRPQFRRWRLLIGDTGYAQGVAVMFLILGQADYFTLGRLKSAATVGIYFFAFTLSMQPVQFLAGNLGGILLPVLSRLRAETQRQAHSFLRAARQLAMLGIPICIAQAVVARPLLAILFHGRWDDAAPVFQILSIGAAFCFIAGPATTLLQARAKFRLFFLWTLCCAVAFIIAVQIGARVGGAESVAAAVAIFYLIFGPLGTYVAIAPIGGRARDVLNVYLAPLVASIVAFVIPMFFIARLVPRHDWVILFATPAIGLPIYMMLARVWMSSDWKEFLEKMVELSSRARGRRS